MDSQRIFIPVKPGGVERGFVGEILERVETERYELGSLGFMRAKEEAPRMHYAYLADKPFLPEIARYMTHGPMVAAIFSGANVTEGVRTLADTTNPTQAVPGSIRGDLACEWGHGNIENLIHASDSDEGTKKGISLWFN